MELRQLALDLRRRNEGYRQLRSRAARGIADRFRSARRRFREGMLQARIRDRGSDAGRRGLRAPGPRLGADIYYNASLNVLRRAGWEPPAAPAEPRPLPMAEGRGQCGAVKREASP